jgi:hypothetical protein
MIIYSYFRCYYYHRAKKKSACAETQPLREHSFIWYIKNLYSVKAEIVQARNFFFLYLFCGRKRKHSTDGEQQISGGQLLMKNRFFNGLLWCILTFSGKFLKLALEVFWIPAGARFSFRTSNLDPQVVYQFLDNYTIGEGQTRNPIQKHFPICFVCGNVYGKQILNS